MKLSWPWPACSTPKSLSFRATANDTVESPEFDECVATDSPEEEVVEAVIRGLRRSTERLFYEPEETSLIVVEKEKRAAAAEAEAAVEVEVESEDPCLDFKKSMVEMVDAYGLKEWDSLEELLSWYLRVNTRKNHGYVVRAFLDLLTFFDFTKSSSSSCSSSLSCNTSSNSLHHHHHHQCCCSSCSTSTTTTSGGGGDSSYVTTTSTNNSNTCCSSTSSTSTPCLSCSLQAEDDDDEDEIMIKDVSSSDTNVVV